MRPFGTRTVAVNKFSTFNLSDSPSSSGECKDDKAFGDTVPFDETIPKDDFFETQVMDYDDNVDDGGGVGGDTQPVDYNDETQIMDLAGETQVMDDYEDFAADTQLLVIPDSETECETDGEDAAKTQVFDDTMHLNDIQVPDTIDNHTNGAENMNSVHCRDDGGAKAKSPPSVDVARRSGSLRRGFTSVRTASLRAAGLAARKMASKNAENGSCSNVFSRESSESHFVNTDGLCTGGRVELKNDMPKHDSNGLDNGHKSNIATSLARKLFVEEDVVEEGSSNDCDLRMEDISQLPSCDNVLAGLSYVDSQEPGELSQANALEFVDRFLKVNLLEPDENVASKNVVCETVTPGAFKKGANSVARDANYRSRVASPSVFEWDDKVEDEGGGEFFIKKRELLFRNRNAVQKSRDRSRSSRHFDAKVCKFPGTIGNEEQQNVRDTSMRFLHSDSKLVKGRKVGKFDEIDLEKKDNNTDQRSHLDACDQLASDAPANIELAELLNVGIDTQMAAEAMEALSTATALVENGSSMSDNGRNNDVDRGERLKTKNVSEKWFSVENTACVSNSGVVTRSRRISSKECEYMKEQKDDLVKRRVKRSRSSVNNTIGDRKKESSVKELQNANDIGQKNTQPIAPNQLNSANGTLDDSRERKRYVTGVQTRKRKTWSDTAIGNPNAGGKSENPIIAVDSCMLDGSSGKGRELHQTCAQDTVRGNTGPMLTAFGSIARRTRSKRSGQSVQCIKDAKSLNSSVLLSPENAFKLSLNKEVECALPAKGTLADVSLDASCRKTQESSCPADITPNILKTPKNAASPICMGDEYRTPSCKKNLFLHKECYKLTGSDDHYSSPLRVLRQRRDVNNIRVLFSQHLDEDTVKQQKKILFRLGFCEASSLLEATHFVADIFVRTRNMLEAIANAKFVVTHLWLESCGQANCFIDEKIFILRDIKKEKELGFSMPMSLARASRQPILEASFGRRVLLTPNIKPSKDVILSLVKAVHGQAVGRLCRSTSNNEKLLEDLLILSCEEDLEECLPLLEKGIAIYSSELLLNGIITQRLEYERILASHHVSVLAIITRMWLPLGILQAINLLPGFWCVHDVFSATGNPQLHLIRLVEFEDELEKDMLSWNDDRRRWVFNLRMEETNWVFNLRMEE
ncbi:hypothetical protein KSS87_015403 [Heliosperma pusillum]|nr:hypothetical protein KSS87_015403 [Heliosperma pusillum]